MIIVIAIFVIMNVENTIKSLLYKHDCVIVPDFGGFVAKQKAAVFQPMDYTFQPPSKKVGFNSNLLQNDGLLANALAKAEQICYKEAMEAIDAKVTAWNNTLEQGKSFEISDIGTFSMKDGHLVFDANPNQNLSLDSFGLTSLKGKYIIRENKQHLETTAVTSNNWVSYAAAIGFALIVGGSSFFANKNLVQPQLSSVLPLLNAEEEIISEPQPIAPVIHINPVEEKNEETSIALIEDEDKITTPDVEDTYIDESVIEENHDVDLSVKPYQVIGGSFKVYARAMEHQAKLRREGHDRAIIVGKVGNFYMVAFDTFHNMDDAVTYKRTLEKQGYDVFMRP